MLDYLTKIIGKIHYSKFIMQFFNHFWSIYQLIVQLWTHIKPILHKKTLIFLLLG